MRPASEAEKARLNDTFAALCRIPSPFGHEHPCTEAVASELRGIGLDPREDAAGNLLAVLRGRADRRVLLCAHVDTVGVDGPIEPVVQDGGWVNGTGQAILGADNKAAVAVILELARRCAVEGSPVGLELLFTVGEENALAGAKQFDVARLEAEFGFVFDHATPIGEVVVASPTYYRLAADFHGRAAHAGIRPEQGRSAVVAAARAIGRMPHGRLDDQTTANVGGILGGATGSTNVVPEHCHLVAEARSLDGAKAEQTISTMVDAVYDAAAEVECDVDVVTEKLFEGYRQKPSAPPVVAAEAALRACGYEPVRIATGGGSDANVLQAAGLPCVNMANGTERNHQPDERVPVAALEGMLDVALALLDAAAEA